MSRRLVARAPGKLFLLGEYAVLDGCPAIIAAVDRFVTVTLERTDRQNVRITSAANVTPIEFPADNVPASGETPWAFVLSAYRAALARLPELRGEGFEVTIESDLDGVGGVKTGLGGSAAVTAAWTAALFASTGRNVDAARHDVFAAAFEAHREAQRGTGSGGDIAASVFGGVVRLQPHGDSLPEVEHLALPGGVSFLVGWTGTPASTLNLVSRYLAATNGQREDRRSFVHFSRTAVDKFAEALRTGNLDLNPIDDLAAAIEQLGTALGLPIITPGLRTLIDIAHAHGAAAKASGAGGGDCGIAFSTDTVAADGIRQAWRAGGITPLDLNLSDKGVTIGCS